MDVDVTPNTQSRMPKRKYIQPDHTPSPSNLVNVARQIYSHYYLQSNTTSDISVYHPPILSHPLLPDLKIEPHLVRDDGYVIYFRMELNDRVIMEIAEEIIHLTMQLMQTKCTKVYTIYVNSDLILNQNTPLTHSDAMKYVDLISESNYTYDESVCQAYLRQSNGSIKKFKPTTPTLEPTPKVLDEVLDEVLGFDQEQWVSASKTRNYALKDTLIDWLDYWYDEENMTEDKHPIIDLTSDVSGVSGDDSHLTEPTDFVGFIMNRGIKFEDNVVALLKARVGAQNWVTICNRITNFYDKVLEYEQQTIKHIHLGTPIIYQAVLLNRTGPLRYSYGIPDLLVRSDYIGKIVANNPLSDQQTHFPAPRLGGKYHYVVIDIKFCTLDLCADGCNIRNSGSFPPYKCQLYVYTHALGQIQGWEPHTSFILGRRSKYTANRELHTNSNCFAKLGHIDYNNWDLPYKKLTIEAINWIRKIRSRGHQWKLLPSPSISELYPNMCNTKDSTWNQIKTAYAKQIGEITLLWNCGVKNRVAAHSKGVYSLYDPRCTPNLMEVRGHKHIPVISSILQINQQQEFASNLDMVSIKLNNQIDNSWLSPSNLYVTVDFEIINCVFDEFQDLPIADTNSYLYMIGVSYKLKQSPINYKSFILPHLSKKAELQLIFQFYDFIKSLVLPNEVPRLYHWGHVERTFFHNLCLKLKSQFPESVQKLDLILLEFTSKWYDMSEAFKSNLVCIKGCFKFGLKEIAGRLGELGLIKSKWKNNNEDGARAMVSARSE